MRAAVLGSPISHSLSPSLHRAAYDALGLTWTYDAVDVDERGLAHFLAGLDDTWRGLSLTMPLKRVVMDHCSTVTAVARDVAAVNTVVRDPDGALHGSNTDVGGLVRALRDAGVTRVRRAVLVGAGATAASALAALRDLGVGSVTVWAREPARAEELLGLARAWGVAAEVARLHDTPTGAGSSAFDVAVSTVPAAAQHGEWMAAVAGLAPVVHDVAYDPWPTPLMSRVRTAGAVGVGGFELLLQQAGLQVEAMTGCGPEDVPLPQMRAAGLTVLRDRSTSQHPRT